MKTGVLSCLIATLGLSLVSGAADPAPAAPATPEKKPAAAPAPKPEPKPNPTPAPAPAPKPEPKPAPKPAPPPPPPKPVLSEGLKKLLPEQLIRKDGSAVSRETLAGKVVGIYIAAQWGAPCRQFTPTLVKFRNEFQKDFEVVFVSVDKDAAAQKEFMNAYKMDWPAVKRDAPQSKALPQHFGAESIPTLIVLAPDGREITRDGRTVVQREYKNAVAKWKASKKK